MNMHMQTQVTPDKATALPESTAGLCIMLLKGKLLGVVLAGTAVELL